MVFISLEVIDKLGPKVENGRMFSGGLKSFLKNLLWLLLLLVLLLLMLKSATAFSQLFKGLLEYEQRILFPQEEASRLNDHFI